MSPTQDDPTRGKSASVRPFAKPGLKRPEDDPVIQMARDRHKKGLQIEKQRHAMSGASGAVLHKILELKNLEADLKAISEGVQEYQDQVALLAATYAPTHPPSHCRPGRPDFPRYPHNDSCPLAASLPATVYSNLLTHPTAVAGPHASAHCDGAAHLKLSRTASRLTHAPHSRAPLTRLTRRCSRWT